MSSISVASFGLHLFQLALSAAVILLSVFVILQRFWLTNLSSELVEAGGAPIVIDTSWTRAVASLAAGGFTIWADCTVSIVQSIASSQARKEAAKPIPEIKLSYAQILHMAFLVCTEALALFFWFANVIIFSSSYGAQNCRDVDSLIRNYNLTSINDEDYVASYYNTQSSPLYPGVPNDNVTVSRLQSELLLRVSGNCEEKQATLGICGASVFCCLLTVSLTLAQGVRFAHCWATAPTVDSQAVPERKRPITPPGKLTGVQITGPMSRPMGAPSQHNSPPRSNNGSPPRPIGGVPRPTRLENAAEASAQGNSMVERAFLKRRDSMTETEAITPKTVHSVATSFQDDDDSMGLTVKRKRAKLVYLYQWTFPEVERVL